MTVTPSSFRADFPEFSDATRYPDSAITFYINLGVVLLSGSLANGGRIWGVLLDPATELYVAHNIQLEKQNADAAATGGDPGKNVGTLSSKGVGPASMGYDVGASIERNAGYYNLTTYGTRFFKLVTLAGAAAVQLC